MDVINIRYNETLILHLKKKKKKKSHLIKLRGECLTCCMTNLLICVRLLCMLIIA